MSKRVLVIHLPQIEVDISDDGNLGDEWITGTMSDAVGKMQLLGKVTNKDLRFNAEAYHPLMKKNNVPDSQGFELRKEGALLVVTLLEDYDPNGIDPDVVSPPRASKSPRAAACTHSSAFVQDSTAATLSTSPDGRVAHHKMWGVVLDTSGTSPCVVLPA
eukprot:1520917-Ditylum_brightwellii.AAC.1